MRVLFFTVTLIALSVSSTAQISFHHFQEIYVGSDPQVVSIADVNNDGLNDVILGTGGNWWPTKQDLNTIFVFIQNSKGELNSPIKYPFTNDKVWGVRTIATADLNNDSLVDIIIGYRDSIGIFFQNKSGTMDPIRKFRICPGTNIHAIKSGDINNDGLNDIVISCEIEFNLNVFYQNSIGFWDTLYPKPLGNNEEIAIGDVNGDGLNDVVYSTGLSSSSLNVYYQNTQGLLDNYISYPSSYGPNYYSFNGLAMGDLNQDNRNDLAVSAGNKPFQIGIWYQDTLTGILQSLPFYFNASIFPQQIKICDLNCDKKNEIITAHLAIWHQLSVYERDYLGNYNSFIKFSIPTIAEFPNSMATGDINNDGRIDIAFANDSGSLVLLINNTKSILSDTLFFSIQEKMIYANKFFTSSYFSETKSYDSSGYRITKLDSFIIKNYFSEDSIKIDSLEISKGEICSSLYTDTTVLSSTYYYHFKFISSDTTLISTTYDTLNLIGDINIYPNPADGIITIELPSPYDSKVLTLILYNGLGEVVLSESNTHKSNKRQLDISDYADGNYILSLMVSESEIISKKIIKSR